MAHPSSARPRKVAQVPKMVEDPRIKLAKEQYEAALAYMNQHKYERAKSFFEKVLTVPSPELVERAKVHLTTCQKRMVRRSVVFHGAEEHYNYAVAQINAGKLAEAEEHLQKALRQLPIAGHLHYALAAVKSLRGEVDTSLASLKRSIDLDHQNRYLARSDRDFAALYEDPRFADLVYPEKGQEM